MHDERSAPDSAPQDADGPARSVFGILTDHHPALLTVDELVREYAGSLIEQDRAELVVVDGLGQLMGSGLAYRFDRFVFASQAAVQADRLRF